MLAVADSSVAVTWVAPGPIAVTTPVLSTVATAGLAALQVIFGDSNGSPRWSLTAADSCRVSPMAPKEREDESIWTVVGTGGSTESPHPDRARIVAPVATMAERSVLRIG